MDAFWAGFRSAWSPFRAENNEAPRTTASSTLTVVTGSFLNIFLTLSDGEPSDPYAVSSMIKSFKSFGIKMVALGVGRDTLSATIIATNLKHLGFERTLGVSRLKDIPKKVLDVLGSN